MKNLLLPMLALGLALGLTIPMAAPAMADTTTLVSGTATQTAGYVNNYTLVDPLDPIAYSGGGVWSNAVAVSSPPIGSWVDPLTVGSGALWVSSLGTTEGGNGDQLRLFKAEFTIPDGAVAISAEVAAVTADNAFSVYFGGSVIGTSGFVYVPAPDPQLPLVYASVSGPYSFSPTVGLNTLYFVVRNWVYTDYNPTGLLYKVVVNYDVPVLSTIEKDMVDEGDGGQLGEHLEVTLTVDNPYGEAIKVEDVIPDGLKYIPGTFYVDSGGGPVLVVPTVDGSTIWTMVAPGAHTITFDVQVVGVECDEVDVINTANVYNPETGLDDSDEVEITLYPYEGFVKEAVIEYEDDVDGTVTVGELVQWDMTITLPNNFGWAITDAVLKENVGGNLGMAGDDVDNDQDDEVDEGGPGDLLALYNTIPAGATLGIETKGKTNKVQFEITGIDIGSGGSLDFVLGIFTDKNPGKKNRDPSGTQEYTTQGCYELNSGATVKFIDPDTGLQLSAHTCPIPVTVEP